MVFEFLNNMVNEGCERVTLSHDLNRVMWEPCRFYEDYKAENKMCRYTWAAIYLHYFGKARRPLCLEQSKRGKMIRNEN